MTQENIKDLERELWDAADSLRGNSKLTAAEYKDPLLGLVLLRFAQNRYEDARIELSKTLPVNPRTGKQRDATKDDYAGAGAILLPEKSKYDYLANLPTGEDIAEAINNAMRLIEAEYTDLAGILPKSYQEFDDKLLRDLVRVFNKDAVKNAKGDVFGRIYEFFLMKFSMQGAGAQEGGEFFTPPSLVNLIVNFIQPNHGIVHDPACGSGGMFVQTAHFIKNHENKSVNEAITVYGTELKSNNTRLAKMNLAIHGIEGKIIESNSFYSNPHNLTGKCDFVMANPPFNVDKVDAKNKFLTEDDRLPFGAPLTGKGTISNGNYLWMQYFYSFLNETGRAGFVMASSATDAGHGEKLIRQQLIESGAVECIVSIANNFFYTRSLPCHIWFFNKGKKPTNQDKILMLDARNTFRKVSTTINDFDEEQKQGLTAIMNSFRNTSGTLSVGEESYKENAWLAEHFPEGVYRDVEGLCKIVSREEVVEQDYSLTPGRYVGVTADIDMDFDYKSRMQEIHYELATLNTEAESLMELIQKVEL
ncbi:N-6 DNA methylase [Leeuwenhoekiella sp. NPDC079379]|uniref:type I restriction-modification system subunit M n=1 Tax=Leeuwenhoekiella sp. NPDC079379 TaxID=3364122 RepID=UPI0037CA429F